MKYSTFSLVLMTEQVYCFSPSHVQGPTAFLRHRQKVSDSTSFLKLLAHKIGVFYGTSTGSTESTAYQIVEEFGPDAAGPFEIDSLKGQVSKKFGEYDALIVGTPTWNTGADTERSGVGWDEIYYDEMQDLQISGKKVAVFGHGDSVSYAENYADAAGELHDVFSSLGCNLIGYTSTEGYQHEESKAILPGSPNKFCGLLLDSVNEEELTEGRVKAWAAQLCNEGILSGSSTKGASISVDETIPVSEEVLTSSINPVVVAPTLRELDDQSKLLEQTLSADVNGFIPHVNVKTGQTMWTSPDGRSSYFTEEITYLKPANP